MSQEKGLKNKINLRNGISCFIITLILFYLIRFLYKNWLAVATFNYQFKYTYLFTSMLFLFCFFLLRVWCWKLILGKMNIALRMGKCIKVSFLSMMGKYLPGKVWLILGKVYLSGKEGVNSNEAFASVVMEVVLEIVASIFFFFFFLFSVLEQPLLSPKVVCSLAVIMIVGMIVLHPRVFYGLLNVFLYKWKGEKIEKCMGYWDIIQLFALYNVIVLVQGTAFYLFVNSIYYVPLNNLLGLTGSLAVAGTLGTLSFFIPSGLGVREGVLALLLSTYVISPIAVLISLLARLWVTLGEIMCALVAWKL